MVFKKKKNPLIHHVQKMTPTAPLQKLSVNQDNLMMKHCKYCVSKLKMALLFQYKNHLVYTIYKVLYFMPHLL